MTRSTRPARFSVEGHAIVSADGMIADHDGAMPPPLRNDADFTAFQAALDRASLVVLGRLGHIRHPNVGRRRLVFTSQVAGFAPDPADPLAVFFNPAGADLWTTIEAMDVPDGTLAITGGRAVFDWFLPFYDRFVLSEVNGHAMPSGIACFSAGHPRAVLAQAGLAPRTFAIIDREAAVSTTIWER